MRKKKLQVFISSTFEDLKEERQAAVEAVLSSGHIPAGMELFSAGDESQMKVIQRWIDESDVYLLILGGRYGSIEKESQKSYTQLEYEYAIKINKPIFSVVIKDDALEEKIKQDGSSVIETTEPKKLKDFKQIVLSKLVKFYSEKKDIKLAIYETLSEFSLREELIGWVRADEVTDKTTLVNQLSEVTQKNKALENELKTSSNSNKPIIIGNHTYEEIKNALSNKKIKIPEELKPTFLNSSEESILDIFLKYQKTFSLGVLIDKISPTVKNVLEYFLFIEVFYFLELFNLVEKIYPSGKMKRQTSKLGNQFLAIYTLQENNV